MAATKTPMIGCEKVQSKQTVIGILIFALVTIISYTFLQTILVLSEGLSVIIALVIGGIVEFTYRKTRKD
jgi:uncharacterized membrane protein